MTPKELLYVEDALNHAKFLHSQCQQALSALTDPALKSCVQTVMDKHQQLFNRFYQLV